MYIYIDTFNTDYMALLLYIHLDLLEEVGDYGALNLTAMLKLSLKFQSAIEYLRIGQRP
jgi:hypothetical protein